MMPGNYRFYTGRVEDFGDAKPMRWKSGQNRTLKWPLSNHCAPQRQAA